MGTKFDSIYHRDRPLWQREEPARSQRAALEFRSEPRARGPTARAPDALRVGVARPTRTRTKASERTNERLRMRMRMRQKDSEISREAKQVALARKLQLSTSRRFEFKIATNFTGAINLRLKF